MGKSDKKKDKGGKRNRKKGTGRKTPEQQKAEKARKEDELKAKKEAELKAKEKETKNKGPKNEPKEAELELSTTDVGRKFVFPLKEEEKARKNYGLLLNKVPGLEKDKFSLLTKERKEFGYPFNSEMHYHEDFVSFHHRAIKSFASKNKFELLKTDALSLDWRLATGLGIASVYETGITLHPVYGVPYLPASSIKGVVRSYAIDRLADGKNKEITALSDHGFCQLFGCGEKGVTEAQQGDVLFFDALAKCDADLEVRPDVMNPHFGPYYMDEKDETPPADWHVPVPIFFLTVRGAKFQFHIAIRSKKNQPLQKKKEEWKPSEWEEKTPLQVAQDLLIEALTDHGIGAKTAVDYGRFKIEEAP